MKFEYKSEYHSPNGSDLRRGRLVLVRGLPGFGKSTFANHILEHCYDAIHIEADQYFSSFGDYRFDATKLHQAHNWCINTAHILLREGKSVIVSNTFTKFSEIKPYVDYAKLMRHDIELYTMAKEYGSIHNVPELTMDNMRSRFESHESLVQKINAY
jgi:uridine kinase